MIDDTLQRSSGHRQSSWDKPSLGSFAAKTYCFGAKMQIEKAKNMEFCGKDVLFWAKMQNQKAKTTEFCGKNAKSKKPRPGSFVGKIQIKKPRLRSFVAKTQNQNPANSLLHTRMFSFFYIKK